MSESDPTPFDFIDYRAWLEAWFQARRGRPSKRGFARRVRCSPTLVSQICNGQRNLGEARAEKWCGPLSLEGDAATYFLAMVRADEGASARQRGQARRTMDAFRRFRDLQTDESVLVEVFSHWVRPVILELSQLPDFRSEPGWICARLDLPVHPAVVRDALDWMIREGLLGRDGDGRLQAAHEAMASKQRVDSPDLAEALHQTHFALLRAAEDWLYVVPPLNKSYTMTTMALSEGQHQAIREEVLEFQRRVMQLATADDGTPKDRVYHLSMQWFPVAGPVEDESEEEE